MLIDGMKSNVANLEPEEYNLIDIIMTLFRAKLIP